MNIFNELSESVKLQSGSGSLNNLVRRQCYKTKGSLDLAVEQHRKYFMCNLFSWKEETSQTFVKCLDETIFHRICLNRRHLLD